MNTYCSTAIKVLLKVEEVFFFFFLKRRSLMDFEKNIIKPLSVACSFLMLCAETC